MTVVRSRLPVRIAALTSQSLLQLPRRRPRGQCNDILRGRGWVGGLLPSSWLLAWGPSPHEASSTGEVAATGGAMEGNSGNFVGSLP